MNKVFGWVIVIFCGLVFMNYVFNATASLFTYTPAHADEVFFAGSNISASASGLSTIDFSFFDKGGIGQSYITQGYGRTPYAYMYINDWHNGIDIAAKYGAPIYSPSAGIVLATGNQDNYCPGQGFGKFIAVADPTNQLVLWYAHLGTISVAPGDTISKGQTIGTVGATGKETGVHLHFSIFVQAGFSIKPAHGCGPDAVGHDVDPLNYLGSTYQ